jgi:hypothetical protein
MFPAIIPKRIGNFMEVPPEIKVIQELDQDMDTPQLPRPRLPSHEAGSVQVQHQHADIISVLSGKSHGSFNRYARRKKQKTANTAGKFYEPKSLLREER